MVNTTQIGKPRLSSALAAAAALLICLLSLDRAGALQNEEGCAHAKPRPAPSYESFFGRQSPVEAESPEWRIDLAKTSPGPVCLHQFSFRARNKRNGAVSEFTVCNETAQVDELQMIKETRALVLGRAAASAPVANVVDMASGKVEDHFGCYLPTLSPGHRFLAFIKDFPGHPGPVEITDEYIVYDLRRDGEYNRPHFKVGVGYDPGWPVYPPGATNAIGENVVPEGSPFHSRSSQALFWLDDDTLAFADFFQGRNNLVVANLSRGVRYADVRTLSLDPSQFIDLDQCRKTTAPSDFESWSKEPAGLIRVSEIDLIPGRPGMACLVFVPSPCLRYKTFIVKLP